MYRFLLKSLVPFLIIALFTQCGKKDELKGCRIKGTRAECLINGVKIKADSVGCTFTDSTNRWNLYIRDTINQTQLNINIYYPLIELDLPLIDKKNVFGKGTAVTTYQFVNFGVTNGNIKLKLNQDSSSVCGEFFYAQKDKINVNQGWFSNVGIKRIK